jgi:hypothetical protein
MKYLTHLICCAALLVFAVGICHAQTNPTQTGALLEINGTVSALQRSQPVDLTVTDSVIHSGPFPCSVAGSNCRVVPLGGVEGEPNCTANDQIATNAYVLQGGSATGCDPGNAFETTQGTGTYRFKALPTNSTPGYQFDATTIYCTTDPNAPPGQRQCAKNQSGQACNTSATVCIPNTNSSSTDTGFMTVTNNGPRFTGTITLSGNNSFCSEGLAQDTLIFSGDTVFATGQSVVLALADDSSSCQGFQSDTTSGDIQPVAPGKTTILLPDGPLTQSITLPPGTTMKCPNTPAVAKMRDVLKLVDPIDFNPTVANGNPGNVPLFGGSSIPGPPDANPHCLQVTDTQCAIIVNQCFDSQGNQFPDCKCIAPPGNSLIGLDSVYNNNEDPTNPAYVIAQDDAAHQQLLPPPLGPDWTNITKSFLPGCTTPPCGTGGGGKRLNGQESIIDLNLTCQILAFTITPGIVAAGSPITISGSLHGCPVGSSSSGLLTFTFEGPVNLGSGCTQTRVSIPPPPPPGGTQRGFPIKLPATPQPFGPFTLTVPSTGCQGAFKFSTTIKSGNNIYNVSVPFTVQ